MTDTVQSLKSYANITKPHSIFRLWNVLFCFVHNFAQIVKYGNDEVKKTLLNHSVVSTAKKLSSEHKVQGQMELLPRIAL